LKKIVLDNILGLWPNFFKSRLPTGR
jgi:hypothetical protein